MKRQSDREKEVQRGEETSQVSRREMVKLTAGAMIVPALPQAKQDVKVHRHKFFTADEFKMVDELGELIIPADNHSPGARAAKCAEFIDGRLAELPDLVIKTQWHDGLALFNKLSADLHGQLLLKTSHDQRIALLERVAANEANPQKPEEKFFVELKARVAHAYYTSEIGIKQELQYKGNTYLREFAGFDISKER